MVELYTEIKYDIPLTTVNAIGGGYDFDKAREFLQSLTPEVLDKVSNGASKTLLDIDIDVTEIGQMIFLVLPNTIAVSFNANENQTILEVPMIVIVDKVTERIK